MTQPNDENPVAERLAQTDRIIGMGMVAIGVPFLGFGVYLLTQPVISFYSLTCCGFFGGWLVLDGLRRVF